MARHSSVKMTVPKSIFMFLSAQDMRCSSCFGVILGCLGGLTCFAILFKTLFLVVRPTMVTPAAANTALLVAKGWSDMARFSFTMSCLLVFLSVPLSLRLRLTCEPCKTLVTACRDLWTFAAILDPDSPW